MMLSLAVVGDVYRVLVILNSTLIDYVRKEAGLVKMPLECILGQFLPLKNQC